MNRNLENTFFLNNKITTAVEFLTVKERSETL